MNDNNKPILCLDFDGVVHLYSTGWKGVDVISDPITDGFWEWVEEAKKYFTLVVYSSRSKEPAGIAAMLAWLVHDRKDWLEKGGVSDDDELVLSFASEKPAAFLTIDDRCLTFTGNWSDFPPSLLRNFKPWNKTSLPMTLSRADVVDRLRHHKEEVQLAMISEGKFAQERLDNADRLAASLVTQLFGI